MADILSQEEIDALLDVASDEGEEVFTGREESVVAPRQVTLYDFKRPNRVSKEQLRSFRGVHDKMARSLASQISSIMRSIVEIQLTSVDQMTYGEFLMSLPSPTSFNVFSVKPLEGNGVIEITSTPTAGTFTYNAIAGDTVTDASVSFYKVQPNISIDIGHGTTAAYDFSQAFYDLELSQTTTNAKVLRGKVNLVRELN
jgi:hypothetical protein